jgi:hypothetical protein
MGAWRSEEAAEVVTALSNMSEVSTARRSAVGMVEA